MGHKKRWLSLFFSAMLIIGVITAPAIADAGNFSGNSNYGGSSGGSSSWGGSGGSSNFGGGSGVFVYGGGSSEGDIGPIGTVFSFIIIAGVIILIVKNRMNRSNSDEFFDNQTKQNYMSINNLKQVDPNFSEAAIKEKVANLYVQMQDAWENKNFEPLRPHMTDMLYTQFARQLEEIAKSNCTNYIDRISVLSVDISGYLQDEVNDILTVIVNTRIVDYTLNDKTGKVVSGDRNMEKFMTYEWQLIRTKGKLTPQPSGEGSQGTVTINCPNCGAPLNINQSAKCPYCGSIITSKDYDWTISSIKGLAQRNGR